VCVCVDLDREYEMNLPSTPMVPFDKGEVEPGRVMQKIVV